MAEWRETTLGELIENFDSRRRPVKSNEREPGPYPYYGASGVIDYVRDHLFDGMHLLIAEDGENLRSRATPIAFLAHGKFWVNNHAHVVRGNARADTRFLSYLLAVTDVMPYLSGSAQPKLSRASMDAIRVVVPSLSVQRAIAEVLSALDDKIAANTRAATKADELARTHFRSVVTGVSFGDQTFEDVAEVKGGGTPSSKVPEYWGGPIAWASPTDITGLDGPYLSQTARTITAAGLANCSSALYPVGSILMTSRATIGAFALAQTPVAVNQGFIVVVPSDETSRYWLFHEMRARVDEFLSHANGATFLELSRGNFRRLPVRMTEQPAMEAFSRLAGALHRRAAAAHVESQRLAATRDALLPALMSGRLRVRDAEDVVANVV